jgi:hypothetical protein
VGLVPVRKCFRERQRILMKSSPRTIVATAVLAAVAATAAVGYFYARHSNSAHASALPDLLTEIPAGAPTLIYVDLAAVRQSGFYQHRGALSPNLVPDNDYKDFVQATGFDFEKDLDRVVIAAWPESVPGEHKKSVAVAEGRFDRKKIRDYAQRGGKLEQQEGHDVLLFQGSKSAEWNSLTFLNDRTVELVQGPSIAPALGASLAAASSDPIRERATRISGSDIFLITRMPSIPDNFGGGLLQSATMANLMRSIQWLSLAVRPEGDNLLVSLEGECATSTDARQLQSGLETVRLFAQAGLGKQRPQTQTESSRKLWESLLKTIAITQTGERVRIVVEVPPEVLDNTSPKKVE